MGMARVDDRERECGDGGVQQHQCVTGGRRCRGSDVKLCGESRAVSTACGVVSRWYTGSRRPRAGTTVAQALTRTSPAAQRRLMRQHDTLCDATTHLGFVQPCALVHQYVVVRAPLQVHGRHRGCRCRRSRRCCGCLAGAMYVPSALLATGDLGRLLRLLSAPLLGAATLLHAARAHCEHARCCLVRHECGCSRRARTTTCLSVHALACQAGFARQDGAKCQRSFDSR